MKKYVIFIMFIVCSCLLCSVPIQTVVCAETQSVDIYYIYSENGEFLFEKEEVEVGDEFVTSDFKKYVITRLNTSTNIGYAKFLGDVQRFNLGHDSIDKISATNKTICMYMTHNDESYVPSDGTESVYGNGGIKDIALAFQAELTKLGINTYFDDTLHIPHDSNAYSRSSTTANKLLKEHSPDALFDIHRDGASRSFYVKNVDGVERCRVRIVIGKKNPDMAINEQFALALLNVASVKYPWLFSDIYYASGHYNQALSGKAILFEMGSHLTEKDLVKNSMAPLADVVNTTLFKTTVNSETKDITIHDVPSENIDNSSEVILTEALEKEKNKRTTNHFVAYFFIAIITVSAVAGGIAYLIKTGKFEEKNSN